MEVVMIFTRHKLINNYLVSNKKMKQITLLCLLLTVSTVAVAQCPQSVFAFNNTQVNITVPPLTSGEYYTTACGSIMTGNITFQCVGTTATYVSDTCEILVFSGTPTGTTSQVFTGLASSLNSISIYKSCFGWNNGLYFAGYNVYTATTPSKSYCCRKIGVYDNGVCQQNVCTAFNNATTGFIYDVAQQLCVSECLEQTANQPLITVAYTGTQMSSLTRLTVVVNDTMGYVYEPGATHDFYNVGYQLVVNMRFVPSFMIVCLYKGTIDSYGVCIVNHGCNGFHKGSYSDYITAGPTGTCYATCYYLSINTDLPPYQVA